MIDDILRMPRDRAKVAADAAKMRAEMERHKPPQSPLDVKLGPGGLVDLEFAVHVLQLTTACRPRPAARSRARSSLRPRILVPANIVDALKLLSRMLVMMRLVAPGDVKPTRGDLAAGRARRAAPASWDELLAEHDAARQSIRELWNSDQEGGVR